MTKLDIHYKPLYYPSTYFTYGKVLYIQCWVTFWVWMWLGMRSLSCPCDSCQNLVESGRIIFGREPCQNCHSGDHLFRNWHWNGPGMDWNGIRQNAVFFFCMYDKVSIILTTLGDMHTSSGMFLSHKGVHRVQKMR